MWTMRNELLRLAVFFGRLHEKWHFSNSVLEPLDGFKNSEVKLGIRLDVQVPLPELFN